MRNGKPQAGNAAHAAGFTYIGVLLMIAIAGIGMAAAGITWHNKIRSEKEKELLFVGDQYRRAIESYYQSAASGTSRYPATLEDMLLDRRYPNIKRHLRKLYVDPMTDSPAWGLVKQQGRIVGVYSLASGKPAKIAGFDSKNQAFKGATSYRDWVFGPNAIIVLDPVASVTGTARP